VHCGQTEAHRGHRLRGLAARHGIPLEGATLYCKMEPCRVCAMLIISVGIKRVVAQKRYHAAQETREMFRDAGVELAVLEEAVEEYSDQ
jgi:dCMP deaminase